MTGPTSTQSTVSQDSEEQAIELQELQPGCPGQLLRKKEHVWPTPGVKSYRYQSEGHRVDHGPAPGYERDGSATMIAHNQVSTLQRHDSTPSSEPDRITAQSADPIAKAKDKACRAIWDSAGW